MSERIRDAEGAPVVELHPGESINLNLAPPLTATTAPTWRDEIAIHPAAELFPLMTEPELDELGADIKANGLKFPIVVYVDPEGQSWLLDGRNRLDATRRAGMPPPLTGDAVRIVRNIDPYEYVVSVNLKRRHLTPEQRRNLIAKLLKRDPGRSDNATAKLAQVSDKTVASMRRELEANSEIPNNTERTEASGRKARGRKPGREQKSEPRYERKNESGPPEPEARSDESPAQETNSAAAIVQQLLDRFFEAGRELLEPHIDSDPAAFRARTDLLRRVLSIDSDGLNEIVAEAGRQAAADIYKDHHFKGPKPERSPGSKPSAELMMIDENLCRKELTATEKVEHIARRASVFRAWRNEQAIDQVVAAVHETGRQSVSISEIQDRFPDLDCEAVDRALRHLNLSLPNEGYFELSEEGIAWAEQAQPKRRRKRAS